MDDTGKLSWGVEVEPPEDMDGIDYNIDPRMRIWKSMTGEGQDKETLKAEEDLDNLHHPSMADLEVQIQNQAALPVVDDQVDVPMKNYQGPEEDRDDIYHPVFSAVDSEEPEQQWDDIYQAREKVGRYPTPLMAKAAAEFPVAHSEPERDEDELYHEDAHSSPVGTELQADEVKVDRVVRVHLQPEEDLDDLYHKDVLQPVPYHIYPEAAAPVDVPSYRTYSEPEEDLDDLYHRWSSVEIPLISNQTELQHCVFMIKTLLFHQSKTLFFIYLNRCTVEHRKSTKNTNLIHKHEI